MDSSASKGIQQLLELAGKEGFIDYIVQNPKRFSTLLGFCIDGVEVSEKASELINLLPENSEFLEKILDLLLKAVELYEISISSGK